ncbi:hypothetical protein JHL17_21405 [Azospirillum sp. YIM B02556]|uniref:Uncharacterized protein n=1 Tax=Azospirillum endophyticum TaxID=2800326 RepID=A0ABS1F9B0_9PROT|nr:hypothetical protein [Azospirillum endophyticum]MBK1839967.1 hypothetical protein [Azospirillum endophyticum]
MRDLFARWAGPVTPPGHTGYTAPKTGCNRKKSSDINAVTLVTPVTPENWALRHAERSQDLLDAFEERAAILEFDGRLSRSEAERRARLEVSGQAAAG